MALQYKRLLQNIGIAIALVVITGAILGVSAFKRQRDRTWTSSCANHFSFIRHALDRQAEETPDSILPSTPDTKAALLGITKDLTKWNLDGSGGACPEAFQADKSMGYIYIGDGLRLGDVATKHALIIFCPSSSHRGSSEHCHAWPTPDGGYCVMSNADMITLLERALAHAKSGEIKYSKRAIAVIGQELAARKTPPRAP